MSKHKEPKFSNADGTLTPYAFTCGYVEQTETMGKRLQLYRDGTWHVRLHDHGFDGAPGDGRILWESFSKLGDARALYRSERAKLLHVGKLEACHADTCFPDYWSGHHLPHVQVPVTRDMTMVQLRAALHSELNQGAVAGSDPITRDDSGLRGEAWFKQAHTAINRIHVKTRTNKKPFAHLESDAEDDTETVYAFFVFRPIES